ncbi:phosphoribosyltransferase [Hafnia paralvei]|uniref:Phosphoribosyl transferase domain protein n=1 Tax=Hafnia alvei TaxID=569 RepID=A0A172WZX4_HAFAL|nr:phosphoribosyltransferase family protein [Hafnia paralvei]ANF29915.1 phosphoribosyl transferase domain protein [Hafnia alvei]TBM00969.1 phosphoribosyltransferase [Hafnia paralvei]
MNYVSLEDMVNDIRSSISELAKHDFDLIVGIPRSGMIPAYLIGLYLNLDVTDFGSFIKNMPLQRGISRKVDGKLLYPQEARKILLVDDSYATGVSLKRTLNNIPDVLKERVTTFCVYSTGNNNLDLDIYLRVVKYPRVFEWNILNHGIINDSCFDIDGVLCVDPSEEENDDGDKYRHFLLNAVPKFIPKYKIKYLVTNRLEKYRKETEQWLIKNNVEYEQLIMLDLETKEARQRAGVHSLHKAEFYKRSGCKLFIESDVRQAYEIMLHTGLHVYCIDNNKMYSPGYIRTLNKQPILSFSKIILWLPKIVYRKLPLSIQKKIKKIIRKRA